MLCYLEIAAITGIIIIEKLQNSLDFFENSEREDVSLYVDSYTSFKKIHQIEIYQWISDFISRKK